MSARPSHDLTTLLSEVARAQRTEAARALAPLGLHPGQDRLLALLWDHDGQAQSALAAALEVEAPTLAKMVARLEAGGFVVRLPQPDDRRISQVWLTDAGWSARAGVQRVWRRLERRLTAPLTERQQATLGASLRAVADSLGIGEAERQR